MVVEIIIARLRQGPIFISEVGWMTRLVVWDHFSMRVQYAPLFLSSLSFSIFHIATTATTFILHLHRLNHSVLIIYQRGGWLKTQSYYLNAIATPSPTPPV